MNEGGRFKSVVWSWIGRSRRHSRLNTLDTVLAPRERLSYGHVKMGGRGGKFKEIMKSGGGKSQNH